MDATIMPQECGSLFIQINEWLAAVHDYFVFALELWCYHKVYANHKQNVFTFCAS